MPSIFTNLLLLLEASTHELLICIDSFYIAFFLFFEHSKKGASFLFQHFGVAMFLLSEGS